ncbi:hypothetical protein [Halosegnis longus]|uniref:Uncharacterized protein n=1 Tax=Halosegnis longus TaxID=2216012 RepID=A0AAJ4UVI2_9EURY|nr:MULTISPECIES: hypothetical protein [Halobacteriales]RNJ25985.1 hypothetical protein Nmn1133_04315 [Salella cibi]
MSQQSLSTPHLALLREIRVNPAGCSAADLHIAAANNGIDNPDAVVDALVDSGFVHQLGNEPRTWYVVSPAGRALS